MKRFWIGVGLETLLFVACTGFLFSDKNVNAMLAMAVLLYARIHVNSYSEIIYTTKTLKFYSRILFDLKKAYNIPEWHMNKVIEESEKEHLS